MYTKATQQRSRSERFLQTHGRPLASPIPIIIPFGMGKHNHILASPPAQNERSAGLLPALALLCVRGLCKKGISNMKKPPFSVRIPPLRFRWSYDNPQMCRLCECFGNSI